MFPLCPGNRLYISNGGHNCSKTILMAAFVIPQTQAILVCFLTKEEGKKKEGKSSKDFIAILTLLL